MKVLKNCLKNLLINLKYYFVPLGFLMFFIVIGLSVGIPIVIASIKDTFNGIAVELGGVTFDWTAAFNKIIEKVVALDQSQGIDSILGTVSNKNWIFSTLTDVARALFGDSIGGQEIINLLKGCSETIINAFNYIVVMAIIGFVVSVFAMMVTVRKTMTKTGWIRAIVYSIIDTAIFIGFVLLYFEIKPSAAWVKILVSVGYSLGTIFISFAESYFFYGFKKLKVKEVINIKNILLCLLGNILVLILGVGLTLIPIIVIPWYGGLILAVPFVEIVFLVIHLNSDGYIGELAREKSEPKKEVEVATK